MAEVRLNPYPKHQVDEASGEFVPNDKHELWQEGFKAGRNEAKGIVQKVNAEADDLKTFERMILEAFIPRLARESITKLRK